MALNPDLNETCSRFQWRQVTGPQLEPGPPQHWAQSCSAFWYTWVSSGARFLWSEGCPLSIQKATSCKKHFFNTNNSGLQYVAIYVPLDTEGWAEMAAITASVTDVGMLDDPTPRIDVHKKNKLWAFNKPKPIGYFWKVMRFVKTKNFRINFITSSYSHCMEQQACQCFMIFIRQYFGPESLNTLFIDTTKTALTYPHNNSKSQKTDWSLQLRGLVWRN